MIFRYCFIILTLISTSATARAQEAAPSVDMAAVLADDAGKPIKDCPSGFDFKADPKEESCPALTLGVAASYAVSFAAESDRQMDWKQKAELRWVVDHYRANKAADLTNKQRDDLMNRIGNLYKVIPKGDVAIFAAMKILQPVEFSKLGK